MNIRFLFKNTDYLKIPGLSFDYWISKASLANFKRLVSEELDCKTGLICGSNEKYIKSWSEIDYSKIVFGSRNWISFSGPANKWAPYNHGGNKRKWYGSHSDVVLFEDNARMMRKEKGAMFRNEQFYFKEGVTWNRVGSGNNFGARKTIQGFAFDDVSPCGFTKTEETVSTSLAYLNSKVFASYLRLFSNGFKVEIGQIQSCPFLKIDDGNKSRIDAFAKKCIDEEKQDWDSFETSWDFKKHPLI